MYRRQYLAGAASAIGFALFAGCSGNGERNENGGNSGGDGTNAEDTSGGSTRVEPTGDPGVTEGDEAIDTGQAPPDVTQTPFENTNTVPEVEGLETGQVPNGTTAENS